MRLIPYYDKLKIDNIFSENIVTTDSSKIRFDSISYYIKNDKMFLKRSTHFGDRIGPFCNIVDFEHSVVNISTGDLQIVESNVNNEMYSGNVVPENYIPPFENCDKNIVDLRNCSDTYKFRKSELINNKSLIFLPNYIENDFDIDYNKVIGLLSILITSTSVNIPFRCDIIIDSELGVNVRNTDLIFKDNDVQIIFKDLFKSFIEALNIVFREFKSFCLENNRKIRIYSSIREFDSFLKVIFVDDNNKSCILHFNNSDHMRTLYTFYNNISENSEDLGSLMEMKCYSASSYFFKDILDIDKIKRNFSYSYK